MNACPHFPWLCLQWRTLDTEILLMFEKHKQNNKNKCKRMEKTSTTEFELGNLKNLETVRIEKYETSYELKAEN